MRKRLRKQPRRMTPPLILRDEQGETTIVELDDRFVTLAPVHSRRTICFLTLCPGLQISVASRCVNKRRVTRLIIRPRAL
jgi:hypothetical protein